jgi:hypothetical protein
LLHTRGGDAEAPDNLTLTRRSCGGAGAGDIHSVQVFVAAPVDVLMTSLSARAYRLALF